MAAKPKNLTIPKTYPAMMADVITPSDSVNLTEPVSGSPIQSRGVWVGVAGNISVEMYDPEDRLTDKTVILVGVLAGSILPISVTRVNSTSTTATDIAILW